MRVGVFESGVFAHVKEQKEATSGPCLRGGTALFTTRSV